MSKKIPVTISILLEVDVSNNVRPGVLDAALDQRLTPKLRDALHAVKNLQLHDFGEGNAEIVASTINILEHPEGSIDIVRGG